MFLDDPQAGTLQVPLEQFPDPEKDLPLQGDDEQSVVLAGGCFWCVEAVYRQINGVIDVVSGYAGDSADTADYRTVCSGRTNHAEAVRLTFDPGRVTFGRLLKVFFSVAHDPTQKDRQGPDVGRQYRSAIFYADQSQKRVAEAYIEQLEAAGVFDAPIVTTLEPLVEFFQAETYHQNYAARNPRQPYIVYTAMPKVEKVIDHFPELVRPSQP